MKKYWYLSVAILCLGMLTSCGPRPNDNGEFVIKKPGTNKEVRIRFYNDGNIEYIQEMENDSLSGFFVNFYKNGKLQNTSTIINGKKEGTGILFYPDGTVKSLGIYKNDLQNGYFWLYDTKRNLVEKREYIVNKGKSKMNQWIRINEILQPVFEESNFVNLDAPKDTIYSDEPYVLNIILEASLNKEYMAVVIGPFDEQFELPANSVCDTLIGKNQIAIYKTDKYKTGLNTIRGVVKDMKYNKESSEAASRNIYFTKEFYVRKKK